jgi:hypothetical protein
VSAELGFERVDLGAQRAQPRFRDATFEAGQSLMQGQDGRLGRSLARIGLVVRHLKVGLVYAQIQASGLRSPPNTSDSRQSVLMASNCGW